jgi:hypothetical protein
MQSFIYIQIHKLEARIENLLNEAHSMLRYDKTLCAMLYPFLRKEAVEKETTKKVEAENPVARVIFIMSYFYFNHLHFNYSM